MKTAAVSHRKRASWFLLLLTLVMAMILASLLSVARAKIHLLENRSAMILDKVPCPVIVTSLDGTINYCNGAAEKLLDRTSGEIIGQPVSRFLTRESVKQYETRFSGFAAVIYPACDFEPETTMRPEE